jgi:hypothetical protein
MNKISEKKVSAHFFSLYSSLKPVFPSTKGFPKDPWESLFGGFELADLFF